MALYRKGNTVTIRGDLEPGEIYFMDNGTLGARVNSEMVRLAGVVCTITGREMSRYRIAEDLGKWLWTDQMFSGKAVKLKDIHIGSDCGLFE